MTPPPSDRPPIAGHGAPLPREAIVTHRWCPTLVRALHRPPRPDPSTAPTLSTFWMYRASDGVPTPPATPQGTGYGRGLQGGGHSPIAAENSRLWNASDRHQVYMPLSKRPTPSPQRSCICHKLKPRRDLAARQEVQEGVQAGLAQSGHNRPRLVQIVANSVGTFQVPEKKLSAAADHRLSPQKKKRTTRLHVLPRCHGVASPHRRVARCAGHVFRTGTGPPAVISNFTNHKQIFLPRRDGCATGAHEAHHTGDPGRMKQDK